LDIGTFHNLIRLKEDFVTDKHFYYDLIVAGFGGQGVLAIGNLIAYAAMKEGKHVTYLPTYGVEMRGGSANCTVVISSREIGSPIVQRPHALIAMNLPSLIKFGPRVFPKGLIFLNSSLINPKEVTRDDLEVFPVPVNEIAIENGSPRMANMIALGAFIEKTRLVGISSVFDSLEKVFDERHHRHIPDNIKAIQIGSEYVKKHMSVHF